MYERFTDHARRVMQLANQEAQRFNHEYIGVEHILLGLIKERSGVAAQVLKNLGIDLRKVRLEVDKLVPSGPDTVTMGKLPNTPRANKVIAYSMKEAGNLNHNYVGPDHILLALLRDQESVAAQVLINLGLKLEDVREEVLNGLGYGTEAGPYSAQGSEGAESGEPSLLGDVEPIELLIDPGSATKEELAELFAEISALYRLTGGNGVNFTVADCRQPEFGGAEQ